MGSCSSALPNNKNQNQPTNSSPTRSNIAVVCRDKVAHLATPITPYAGALMAELSVALGLSPTESIAGFFVEPEIGGPLCPLDLLHRLHSHTPVEAVVVKTCDMKLSLGPLPPINHEDFEVNTAFVAELGSPESLRLSANLVRVLLRRGYVRLCISPELTQVVEDAKRAAQQFWDLDPADRYKAKTYLRDGKYLGFVNEGAREYVQLRLSEHGMQWPKGADAQARAFKLLFVMLQGLSHQCLRLIAQGLGLDVQYIRDMLDVPDQGTLDASRSGPSNQRGDKYVGSDVFRVYRYFRAPGQPPPGLRNAATGLHCDMGLLTLTPASSSRGLAVLSPDGSGWIDAEVGARPNHMFLFLGETLARLAADPFSLARRETTPDLFSFPEPQPQQQQYTAQSPPSVSPATPTPPTTATTATATTTITVPPVTLSPSATTSSVVSNPQQPLSPSSSPFSPNDTACEPPLGSHAHTVSTLLALQCAGRLSDAAVDAALRQLGNPPVNEEKFQPKKRCLRAPMHFVDEKESGVARFSFPFFLRCRPDAKICSDLTVAQFMENTVLNTRPWTNPKRTRMDY